ncbi:MAG: ABC transporter permease [Lysinibacillus sp.]|nr:ABC transporter permease [Lysinibacillus sp.]
MKSTFQMDSQNTIHRKRLLLKIIGLLFFFFIFVLSGFLIGEEQIEANLSEKNLSPSLVHLFGTDWLGRDMFMRTLKGLNLSFQVGLLASSISAVLALTLSLLASKSRLLDYIVTILIDLFLSIPHLVALILIAFVLGGGIKGIVVGIALTHWPTLTRVLRAEIMQIKSAEYVQLSKKLGKSRMWIVKHHFIPHLIPQLFVGFVLLFPHAILHESAITFLGFGLSPEQPAIGIILSESMKYLSTGMWWLVLFPGISLIAMVAIFDALGNNLRKFINRE